MKTLLTIVAIIALLAFGNAYLPETQSAVQAARAETPAEIAYSRCLAIVWNTPGYQRIPNSTTHYKNAVEFTVREKGSKAIVGLFRCYRTEDGAVTSAALNGEVFWSDQAADSARRQAARDTGRDTVRQVQELLNARGYNVGPADGIAGKRTVRAANQLLSDIGIDDDNYTAKQLADPAQLRLLQDLVAVHLSGQ